MKITAEWLKEKGACGEGRKWVAAQDTNDAAELIRRLQKYNSSWAIWLMARIDDLTVLTATGVDVNAKNNYGYTALRWAAGNGYEAVVKTLIAAGADVNAKSHYGDTALTLAAGNGHEAVVDALIAAGGTK